MIQVAIKVDWVKLMYIDTLGLIFCANVTPAFGMKAVADNGQRFIVITAVLVTVVPFVG